MCLFFYDSRKTNKVITTNVLYNKKTETINQSIHLNNREYSIIKKQYEK